MNIVCAAFCGQLIHNFDNSVAASNILAKPKS